MLLNIFNPNGIVQTAHTKNNELAFSLIINTTEKWVTPSKVSRSSGSITYHYEISGDEDEYAYLQDAVTLIAEDSNDREILGRLPFDLLDTDQLWVLFPSSKVLSF